MKTISIISISLLIVFAASCKSSKSEDQAPKLPKVSTAPIVILDAVWNQDQTEVTLTFKEQKEYDPNLLEITTSFYKKSNNSFSLIDDKPSHKWIAKELGRMNEETPQLIFFNLKDVARVTVNVGYDSEEFESKTFDYGK